MGELDLTQEFDVDLTEVEGKYLTFWTDSQLYGIPIAEVVQIVQYQQIVPVPEAPYYMVGIINLRGSIIPVTDVRIRFGKETKEYTERSCIIVTSIQNSTVGFIVDGVNEVTDIEPEYISETPAAARDYRNEYLTGIGKKGGRVTLLLDVSRLLSEEAMATMSNY